jgi:hypothetical protein
MNLDGISENMIDTTIILPLTVIEENIDESGNNHDEEYENINKHYYQQMDKYPLRQNGKRMDSNKEKTINSFPLYEILEKSDHPIKLNLREMESHPANVFFFDK